MDHSADRLAAQDELEARLTDWTAPRTAEDVQAALRAHGVPVGLVATVADVERDPQLAHRDHMWPADHR